ncbi:MlaD family protein [Nonomuraea sp. NPDC048916]|uniref:MlaD family protein n=1 Tax=Nonomuraea sp. NPDC048916 TaxID=3154232 RepID=UPI0033FC271E
MNNRIYLNLGFFVVLGVVMTVWAFSTIIKVDAITRPYRVSAEFASSPGLMRGFDVAYLGVRVGKIGEVRLATGKIVVGLDIDKEIRLPKGSTAEVRRRSAIGEPYVELSPPATGVTGASLAPGDVIPMTSTSVPLDYRKLFEGVGRLLNAVPPRDAKTITHELAVALDGRSGAIRSVIDDAHDLTGTLADNSKLLDDLSVQLTQLTHTLAGRKDRLASGITDLSTVTGSLRASRADLNAFLDQGPGVFGRLDQAVKRARPGLSCLLTAAGLPHRPAFSAQTERNAHHLLSIVPTALSLADDISDKRGDTVYGKAAFIFSVPGGPQPAEEYENPVGPPTVPRLRACPDRVTVAADADVANDPVDDVRHDRQGEHPETRTSADTAEPARTLEAKASSSPSGVAATTGAAPRTPLNTTPLIVAIFLAIVASGGIVGWIAAGRAARRGKESG